jgi:uncharacterized membrane protein YecN with MAPEG domain
MKLFLQHNKKYGNAGKIIPSYLAVVICEEFMGSKMLAATVIEIQKVKCFTISVDYIPDAIHVDQLTLILQYAKNAVPKE